MSKIKNTAILCALLAGAACTDLEVSNLNDPDAERALATAQDIESLIAASYGTWWLGQSRYAGPSFVLSAMSFQHSAWPANQGVYFYGNLPRPPVQNNQVHQEYAHTVQYAWNQNYGALAAISAGLRAFEEKPELAEELGADALTRLKAYGKFVQGLAHGSIALLYDRGFIVDETVKTIENSQPADLGEPVGYAQIMEAALGYLDEAIEIAKANQFTIPAAWMGDPITSADLVKVAHSMKARFRAMVARNPDERAAVDWDAVLADVNAGIDSDFIMTITTGSYATPWTNDVPYYFMSGGWQQATYMIVGMADTSGNYQKWINVPVAERRPDLDLDGDGDLEPVLIQTPDKRFPQGATLAEQRAQRGTIYVIPDGDYNGDGKADYWSLVNNFQRPDRGTWRWSYYINAELANHRGSNKPWEVITKDEMNLLAAEAHYRRGRYTEAADLINLTRVAAGLPPAAPTVDGGNTGSDCVPRLPNGDCGDLFEMLKWEKRLETQFRGPYNAPGFFYGRGWGDLYVGTPVHMPIPSKELQVLGLPRYTFGGAGGEGGAPPSGYGYPHEQ